MTKQSKNKLITTSAISLIVLLTVILSSCFFHVDTVNITDSLKERSSHKNITEYSIDLPDLHSDEPYEIMFQSTGNTIEIESRNKIIYEYGSSYAAENAMIGRVYVHALLPDNAYNAPLHIKLRAVDVNASNNIHSVELCPYSKSSHYYISNIAYGFPIALMLIAAAFCIPFFLLLNNERRLIREGILFSLLLVALSILLLDCGGHFMLFFSNQHTWSQFALAVRFLFPVLFLLYFWHVESLKYRRRLILGFVIFNFVFCFASFALIAANILHFYDLNICFYCVLTANILLGVYAVICNIREKSLSKSRSALLNLGVLWGLIVLVLIPFQDIWHKISALPEIDPLSICSVLFFFTTCGLFFESAKNFREIADNKSLRIEQLEKSEKESQSTEAIAQALYTRYESIYAVEIETGSYKRYHESEAHGEMGIDSEGENFFDTTTNILSEYIYNEDSKYFREMISKDAVLINTENDKTYSFIYRVIGKSDSDIIYHKIRASRGSIDGKEYVFIGIRDIDAMMQREKKHEGIQNSLLQKERNHMKAILASSAGYMEINLTQDKILEQTNIYNADYEFSLNTKVVESYTRFMLWLANNIIVENSEGFLKTNDRNGLIESFKHGELRASVSFSTKNKHGVIQPCRQVAYLYLDTTTKDIMCLNVTYDLTSQQKAEKEMTELKEKLQMSRLRVFTGQMQPHFLYNALGSIQEIILENPQYASELVGDFTIHLRASIRAMSSDNPIPFERELENIKAYINIEKMRFGNKLNVIFDINATDFEVSPLSIQPLVENSIRHGIYEKGAVGGTVKIKTTETTASWIVKVVDNGVGFDTEVIEDNIKHNRSQSAGLRNLIFRLNKVMNAEVSIKSKIGHGTCVTVIIPKGDQDESNNS